MKSRLLLALFLSVIALPARAAWRVAESAHFRVFGEMSENRLRDQVQLLEDYRNLLGMFTNANVADGGPRLDVYLVERFGQAVPFGKAGDRTAGVYIAGANGIAAFAEVGDAGQHTLLHEYAHHHMFAGTGLSYPAWYVEGFAEYFSTATFRPKEVEFGLASAGRAYALQLQPWLPWEQLITVDSDSRPARRAACFTRRAGCSPIIFSANPACAIGWSPICSRPPTAPRRRQLFASTWCPIPARWTSSSGCTCAAAISPTAG